MIYLHMRSDGFESSEVGLINKQKNLKSLAIKHGASVLNTFLHSKPSVGLAAYSTESVHYPVEK